MFKKTLLALTLGITAASFSAQTMAENLKVGTHPTFAPFEFIDMDGKIIGFDIDVINAIAKANGDEVTMMSMPFDGLIPSLITGNIDVIIAGLTITEARQKRVLFSDDYYDSNLSMLIRKEDESKYTTTEALKGKPICVQIGTTAHTFADKVSPGVVKALNDQADAMRELQNKGCEALINDRPVNLYYLNKSGLDTLVDVVAPEFKVDIDSFGIAVRKGEEELRDKLNAGLEKIRESGELEKIHVKWFGKSTEEAEQELEAMSADEE
ncbi:MULTISPECIES: basic amino acid ABC transporter substrate-binding protein [unclassified Anaerobiospirillum]|uniref:basic amino acid ABC transporter substrate-binding protein n=1 Tax=unclassified Anaerobiospirillum TaxID=2647410 RepID=UPI001FF36516|nr:MULTISPECIES: basic amino acid ABC transporter substrate-binding protein [unclassified Anaerobiospirillum]MCK0534343.1 basic amino acid ABC transporter substrate-binding protein [Anaerobiospirillum sp. NML120511]MCK0539612.1 basic amino acid ABC transporter substrate-binding protein [Anaerobiospirillum sp. NML02-A-032]